MRLRLGDVFEVETSRGFWYGQYVARHPEYGYLVTIAKPPTTERLPLEAISWEKERIKTFLTLSAALKHDPRFRAVGNAPISERNKKFPTFRAGVPDLTTGRVRVWWLWDGIREWKAGELTPEQRLFPNRILLNGAGLIDVLEGRLDPEVGYPPSPNAPSEPSLPVHYIYTRAKAAADELAADIAHRRNELQGQVEVSPSATDERLWLLKYTQSPQDDFSRAKDVLERLASMHDVDYDGWEIALPPVPGTGQNQSARQDKSGTPGVQLPEGGKS